MHPRGSDAETVRRQLGKILASPGFARNERLSGFLRFVVERHLEGRGQELKESVLAIEIFGRGADHNPKQDAIVRTEAGRLRARLGEYYLTEGKGDELVIELPKGGYVPAFTAVGGGEAGRRSKAGWRASAGVALALAGFAGAGLAWWLVSMRPSLIPIAVLPLVNLSPDTGSEYFADGLTGEIIRHISIIDGLLVRSQTSSFAFKGKPRNVREAGAQLAAEYILEGSVLRAGERLRVNAQLVRAKDDYPVWSGRYERQMADIFAIQDEIALGIVNSLRLKLGRGRRRYETNPEAYDLYLRARAPWVSGGWSQLNGTVEGFEAVIAKDPRFAPAYADLALAHATRSGQARFDVAAELPKMRAAARKAVELDPLLAEGQDALGVAYSRDGQWEQSEASFLRAIELDPKGAIYYGHYVMFHLLPLGRIEEALKQLRAAEKTDPVSYEVQFDTTYVLLAAGRHNDASAHCDKLPADTPDKTWCVARIEMERGRAEASIRMLDAAIRRDAYRGGKGDLGLAYARAGRRGEAEKLASEIGADAISQARVYAALGDREHALDALDRATVLGPFRLGRALAFQEFRFLGGDPRMKSVLKKAGLPESSLGAPTSLAAAERQP